MYRSMGSMWLLLIGCLAVLIRAMVDASERACPVLLPWQAHIPYIVYTCVGVCSSTANQRACAAVTSGNLCKSYAIE